MTCKPYVLLLTAVTLAPYFLGMNSAIYFAGALVFDGAMLFFAVRFLLLRNRPSARALFFTSIFYLPAILGLMVFTKA